MFIANRIGAWCKTLSTQDARTIKVLKNITAMCFIRGISIGVSFLYVPLLLNVLDQDNYAIWLTLTSIIMWVAMLDIGMGNGLRNKLSEAIATDNAELARSYVSSSYAALGVFMVAAIGILLVVSSFVPWNLVLNAKNHVPHLALLCNIVLIAFGVQFVLNLLNSIFLALQMPAIASLVTMCCQLFSFIATCIAVYFFHTTSLLFLGVLISIIPVFVMLLASVIAFRGKYAWLSPGLRWVRIGQIRSILSLGFKFFILQIITIILFQTNNIVISHTVSAEAVIQYNIAYKYMSIISMGYIIFVTPIWSATTDAYARGDMQWIKGVLRKLYFLLGAALIGGAAMLLLSGWVYRLWLRSDEIQISFVTSALVLGTVLAKSGYSNYGYIINGTGKVMLQLIVTGILALLYLPSVWVMGLHWGLAGILWANIIIFVLNMLWAKLQLSRILSGKAYGIWNR